MNDAVLYLRLLQAHAGEVAAWRTSDGVHGRGTLSDAAMAAVDRRVVVFIPSAEVLLLDAVVPTRKREHLLQAVPYALEERLVADVETLHFALGRSSADTSDTTQSNVAVAVVARTRMDAWLAELESAGISPHALVPDVLALPLTPGYWTFLQEPTVSLLRTGAQSGCALEPEWLSMVLEEGASEIPLGLRVANDGSPAHATLPFIALPIEELPCPNGALALLVEGYRPDGAINLLQGAYKRYEPLAQLWQPLRVAAILLVSFLLLQFSLLVLDRQQLAAEDVALRSHMADIYLHTFPSAHRVVNPRAQMEQRLNDLRTQPEEETGNFLGLLVRAAPVLGASAVEVHALRYKDDGIELTFAIKNLQLLDQFKQRLSTAGLDAEIRSARAEGEGVDADMQIRGANTPTRRKP